MDKATLGPVIRRVGELHLPHEPDIARFLPILEPLVVEHPQLPVNGLAACAMAHVLGGPMYTCNEELIIDIQRGHNAPEVEFRSPATDATREAIAKANKKSRDR